MPISFDAKNANKRRRFGMANESASPRYWLSTGAEALALKAGQDPAVWDCDVLIVGSGYGGACAAYTLAGATRNGTATRVWVLERGDEYPPGQFPSRFRDLPGHVRFSMQDGQPPRGVERGLFDLRIGGDMSVLLGNGLGGGSLINSGVMAAPEAPIFASGWPSDTNLDTLKDWFSTATQLLQPSSLPDEVPLGKLDVLDGLGQQPGQRAARCPVTVNFGREEDSKGGARVPSCTLCGDCLTGCNVGAKRSLDTNLLVAARGAGAEIFCGGFVERLEPIGDEDGWLVHWHLSDPSQRGESRLIRARHVVLAAGTLGSTEILMRSRAELKNGSALSPMLGREFTGNGDSIIAARGHTQPVHSAAEEESDPKTGMRHVGPTIVGMQKFAATADHPAFILEEFAVPGPLRQVYGEITALLEVVNRVDETKQSETGGDLWAVTSQAIDHTSLYGQIIDEPGTDCALTLPQEGKALESGIKITAPGWADRQEALKARAAIPFPAGISVVGAPEPQGRLPVSTHPLGGCKMADTFDKGVVDRYGRVFRSDAAKPEATFKNLAVLDGSIIPVRLIINPALTISALALRGATHLLNTWDLKARTAAPAPLSKPRPFSERQRADPAGATWRIREKQTTLEPAADGVWAGVHFELRIEFEPIESFRKFLAKTPPFVVSVRTATLKATRPGAAGGTTTHVLAGTVTLFDRGPAENPSPSAFKMVYDLREVEQPGVQTGIHVVGTKYFNPDLLPDAGDSNAAATYRSPWRELSEITLTIDGADAGRAALDLDDLVDQSEALLQVESFSSMPDMLDDLGAVGLFILRHLVKQLVASYALAKTGMKGLPDPEALQERRRAGAIDGIEPSRHQLKSGAVLSRYAATAPTEAAPVLLIHGLAMSGNSFTHPVLGGGLAASLLNAGRNVWILDLRSSIANASPSGTEALSEHTVEVIARDIPMMFKAMERYLGKPPFVDVFAHCFGGVMFCVAALRGGKAMAKHIRRVVLSQVGPMIELSPLNRFRGFLAAYFWRHGQIQEFDCVPKAADAFNWLIEAVCATFPYPDEECKTHPARTHTLAHCIRHRADVIFGQL